MDYVGSGETLLGVRVQRNIGVSMLSFASMLSIGTAFTNLIGNTLNNGALIELIFWDILIVIATLVLTISFTGAHISSTKLMNEKEHTAHSKHIGAWLAVLVVGAIVSVVPMLFFNSSMALIVFMFSFGGMLWIMYLSVYILFKHAYHEIAIAAVTLWIAFAISFEGVSSLVSGTPIGSYAMFISTVVVITVSGTTGMAMLFNASREFMGDFLKTVQPKETTRAARRKRRAS